VPTPFLIDADTSASLKDLLPGKNARKTTDFGLSIRADDLDVINLAFKQRSILVSSDVRFVQKCGHFQTKYGCCLWGLLLLPNGIEYQRRILSDLMKGRKVLRFREIRHPLTWASIRDLNFLVRAGMQGHPHVTELCDCKAWED
jgi:hypothetical protein